MNIPSKPRPAPSLLAWDEFAGTTARCEKEVRKKLAAAPRERWNALHFTKQAIKYAKALGICDIGIFDRKSFSSWIPCQVQETVNSVWFRGRRACRWVQHAGGFVRIPCPSDISVARDKLGLKPCDAATKRV